MPQTTPLNLTLIRECAARILASEAELPRYEDVQRREQLLRGHIALVIPEVEALAATLPDGHATQASAVLEAHYARARLDAGPGAGLVSAVRHMNGLARALRNLCDQYEALGAARQEQRS